MFVGLTVQNFSQIGRVVSSHEWLQTHRQTDTQTDRRTHAHTPRSGSLPPDYRNTFSLLKRLNEKTRKKEVKLGEFEGERKLETEMAVLSTFIQEKACLCDRDSDTLDLGRPTAHSMYAQVFSPVHCIQNEQGLMTTDS